MTTADENVKKQNVVKLDGVEWEFELEVGSNKVTAKGAYRDDYTNWMARCPAPGSAHPDINALTLKKISAKRQEGWVIDVTLSYECNDPEANYPGRQAGTIKRYTIEPTTGEEPILTFRKLDSLSEELKQEFDTYLASDRDKTAKGTLALAVSIAADENANALYDLVTNSVEAYRSSGIVWVERFSTKRLSDMQCEKFYKIDSPPGNPPTLADGANWLYIPGSADPHDDGKTWDMERRWEASLPGGWSEWLYGEGETPEDP